MRRTRIAAAGAAGAVLLSVGVTLASPGDELAACRSTLHGVPQVTIRADRWVRIAVPKFDAGEGPATIKSVAAMPEQKNGLMVTNGQVVKLSMDAGCTWQTVYSGNNVKNPAPGSGYTPDVFTQVVEPSDTSAWVTSYDDINGVPHPHVYLGTGMGSGSPTFTQNDVGLPTYGKPASLVVPFPGNGEAYLLVDQLPDPTTGSTAAASHLYATAPANPPQTGAVAPNPWQEITLPSGFGHVDGLVRQYAHRVWIWSGRHYASASTADTSKVSWTQGTAAGPIATMDVDATGNVNVVEQIGGQAVLAQPNAQGTGLIRQMSLPIVPYALTHGTFENVYVESGAKGTWGYDHLLHKWIDITPRGGPAFHVLTTAQATSARIVLGMASDALWRWDTYTQETFVPPPPPPPSDGRPPTLPHSDIHSPVLTPTKQVVSVTPGTVSRVPVTLRVPPDPTPLDVYFLLDTTSSMSPAIDGLRHSVVTLARHIRSKLGLNACFGVGGVKDFEPTSSYVFQTFLPVSSCDTEPGLPKVTSAVNNMSVGGGGDPPEAQTLALKLAVTGQSSVNPPVPIPQPAGFRPGAFHVVVYISDAPSHQADKGDPTIDEVVNTFNASDVKIVSIAFHHGGGDINGAMRDMTELAQGTGSFAPSSGVDCNGDGGGQYGDLGPGAPLVCQESATLDSDGVQMVNIEPAIFGLLLAVKDPGTIEVKINDPQHALKAPIQGPTSHVFDMKYENGLRFTLPVGCAPSQVGKVLPIKLTPYVRSQYVGLNGEVDVDCRGLPKVLPVPPIVPAAAPLIFAPAARPPVAVAPPVPPNPPAQPATNVNPNAGMAREEQQQPQLAMAAQDSEEAGEDTEVVEMSAMRNPVRHSDALFLLGAAVLMGAAAGCQMHLRRRNAYARQSN